MPEENGTQKPQIITVPPAPDAASAALAAKPKKRPFWKHPWFYLGIVVLIISVVFTLMNNREVDVVFIGMKTTIALPLLMLLCALLGAAIEFFTSLSPRMTLTADNRRLRKQLAEVEKRGLLAGGTDFKS